LREVYEFLEVDKSVVSGVDWERKNAARYPRSLFVQKLVNHTLHRVRMFCYDYLDERRAEAAMHAIRVYIALPLRSVLLKDCGYPPMNGETRANLLRQFEKENRKLGELINRDVGGWNH
jgi:hypothetical protein